MKPKKLTAVLWGLLLANALKAESVEVPVLTVCEALSDLERYTGKSVIVVGRTTSTDEGSWLDESCGLKVVRGDREFEAVISTTYIVSESAAPPTLPNGFRWDK